MSAKHTVHKCLRFSTNLVQVYHFSSSYLRLSQRYRTRTVSLCCVDYIHNEPSCPKSHRSTTSQGRKTERSWHACMHFLPHSKCRVQMLLVYQMRHSNTWKLRRHQAKPEYKNSVALSGREIKGSRLSGLAPRRLCSPSAQLCTTETPEIQTRTNGNSIIIEAAN